MKHDPNLTAADPLADYAPVALRTRRDGWTAERQRIFLTSLAETGCISRACQAAEITARSAWRLRNDPRAAAFAAAWDQALRIATSKLITVAYERALNGSLSSIWRDGKLVAERFAPSDKLLMFLLSQFAPWDQTPGTRWARLESMSGEAGAILPGLLDRLKDSDVPADRLGPQDYMAPPPPRDDAPMPFDADSEAW